MLILTYRKILLDSEEDMQFCIGDQIAHPMHGAGVIAGVEKRKVDGIERDYYVLQLPSGGMQVMIPVSSCESVGVRPIVDESEANRILNEIPDIQIEMTSNWNKRYRDNMLKIKSGDLLEVASVIKGLMLRDNERGLSTGERKMLHSAKQILISELVMSKHCSYDEIEQVITTAVNQS